MSKKIYLCTNNFYTLFGTVSRIMKGGTTPNSTVNEKYGIK